MLADTIKHMLKAIKYDDEIDRQYKDESQAEARKEVIADFVNSIGQYVEKESRPSLQGFLETTALMDKDCLLYTSPSPRDQRGSRMPSSA